MIFPRTKVRGSVEAERHFHVIAGVGHFPRTKVRGSVEANQALGTMAHYEALSAHESARLR